MYAATGEATLQPEGCLRFAWRGTQLQTFDYLPLVLWEVATDHGQIKGT